MITIQKHAEGLSNLSTHFEGWLVRGLIDGRIQLLNREQFCNIVLEGATLDHLRSLKGDAQAVTFYLQAHNFGLETPGIEVAQEVIGLL